MIPGLVASGVAVATFSPADIAGLRIWLDATQMGLNDGDAVATWSDLSGGGRHATQGTAGNQPIYKTGIINGKPVVRFDGVNDVLNVGTNPMSGVTAATAFIVVKLVADPPTASNKTGLWFFGTGTSPHFPWTDGTIYEQFGTTVRKLTVNPTPSLTSPRIYGVVTAPNDFRTYLDGTLLYSTASNTVGFYASPSLGGEGTNFLLTGDIGEFIVYSAALGTSDRQQVEAYLKAKWGIA